MGKKIILVICCFSLSLSLFAQSTADIGKIIIGVFVPSSANRETLSNKEFLIGKLTSIATQAGYSSFGNNQFVMVPNVVITDISMAEGGMKNIYVVNGNLSLSIQEIGGNVYSSITIPFRGSGKSESQAIKNGVQKVAIEPGSSFFSNAKEKILSYYSSKQELIFAQADMCVSNNEYDKAIACLMAIPEELFDLYHKAYDKAIVIYGQRDIYLKEQEAIRVKKANNQVLVAANNYVSMGNGMDALKALLDYEIAETSQDEEYFTLKNKAGTLISEQERQQYEEKIRLQKEEKELKERKLAEEERQHRSEEELEKERINALKEIAVEYYRNQNVF